MNRINPATGAALPRLNCHSDAQVRIALEKSAKSQLFWGHTEIARRASLLRDLASVLRKRSNALAKTAAIEMGKPVSAGRAEVEKCAGTCEWFAERGPAMLLPRAIPSDAADSSICYEPLGTILAVMPWNFPYWQAFRFAAPALLAGNTGILKHAENVGQCALEIESVFLEAGFAEGVFQTLLIDNAQTQELIGHPQIAAVSLTGSERAGMAVAAAAGRALKKCVLELGGSDPFIVLEDVNIAEVARIAASARCINSGQSCIAAKRFLVQSGIAGEFESRMMQAMAALKVGDPLDESTVIGPLARRDLLDQLQRQVDESIRKGARLAMGGKPLERPGFYYPPTILAEAAPGQPAFDEELFGPVAALASFDTDERAIQLANQSPYGLGASIWTRDEMRARAMARQIQSGSVFINGIVKSDSRLPFGGIKRSGYGRELSEAGLHEFVNLKTVWIGKPA